MSDFSEIFDLERDLRDAPAKAIRNIDKAVRVTAHHVKDDWSEQAAVNGLEPYAQSVDYDMKYPRGAIEAEIGPNLAKKQGQMSFVDEAGGDVRSAPQHAARDALRANEDDFGRGVTIAAFEAFDDD